MQRRSFLSTLLRLAGLAALPALGASRATAGVVEPSTSAASAGRAAPQAPLLLQISPLAGFQYHQGEACWPELQLNACLTLTREQENRHDARAIRVDWQGRKLGYVPRAENATLASLMDRGHRLEARIQSLKESPDPWKRVALEIYLTTGGAAT